MNTFSQIIDGVIAGDKKCEAQLIEMMRPSLVKSIAKRYAIIGKASHHSVDDLVYDGLAHMWGLLCKNDYKTLRALQATGETSFIHYVGKCARGIALSECEKANKQYGFVDISQFEEAMSDDTYDDGVDWDGRKKAVIRFLDELPEKQAYVMRLVLDNLELDKPLPQNELAAQNGMDMNSFNHSKCLAMRKLHSMAAGCGQVNLRVA